MATKKRKKNKIIPKTKSEKILVGIIIALLVIVLILGIVAICAKSSHDKKMKETKTVAILDNKTNGKLNVDISKMNDTALKDYKFEITNYKDGTINSNKTKYKITITKNSNNVSLALYRNDENKELLNDDKESMSIEYQINSKKKKTDKYYLIIKANSNIDNKKSISIKIDTIN